MWSVIWGIKDVFWTYQSNVFENEKSARKFWLDRAFEGRQRGYIYDIGRLDGPRGHKWWDGLSGPEIGQRWFVRLNQAPDDDYWAQWLPDWYPIKEDDPDRGVSIYRPGVRPMLPEDDDWVEGDWSWRVK